MNQIENYNDIYEIFTSKDLKKNSRIFQITGVDITVLIVPVIVLVWLDSGLAFNEMLLLQGIFVLPILILEVPSGSLADYWSRKGCTALFHCLFAIAMLIYAIGDNFYVFALAEFIGGIGISFQTGSETALIYDSLYAIKKENVNDRFGNILSKRMTIMFTGAAIGAIFGGIIGSLSMIRLPIYLSFVGHIIFAGLVWSYSEPPRLKPHTPQAAIKKAIKSLNMADLQAILLFSITYSALGRIAFWAVQHVLVEEFVINAFGMGIILSSFNLCAAISSLMIKSHVSRFSNYITFLTILMIEILYFWILILVPDFLGLILISILAQITRGIRTPLTQAFIQQFLDSDVRATFISLLSLVGSFLYLVLSVIIEKMNFSRNIALIIAFSGMIFITIIFLSIIIRKSTVKSQTHVSNIV